MALLWACTTTHNTPMTRFYHSFTARYNTYFNGHEAYKEGLETQINGHKDNFTEIIPFFDVSNTSTASLGKSNYDVAIEKCEKAIKNHSIKRRPKLNRTRRLSKKQKAMLKKKEYNPFLKNAWILMGMSQFRQGKFVEAASTFSYINRLYATEPDVLAESRAWLAACYCELNWFYDAEDIFRNKLGRDSIPHSAQKYVDFAYSDYYVRQKMYKEALPYLKRSAKHIKGSRSRARVHFLMGQIYDSIGDSRSAYKELSKVVRLSPPYEVQLNAKVLQAEVMPASKRKSMISRLKRMAKKSKNATYCDQIYHALGNLYLDEKDSVKAIEALENGVNKSTRNGVEKGAICLKLAEIYYAKGDFTSCRRNLDKAVSLISKERKDYAQIQNRAKIIDKLEPHTAAVFAEDSVQALSRRSPEEQNKVFDAAIEIEKKRQRAERRKNSLKNAGSNTGQRNRGNRDNAASSGQDNNNNNNAGSKDGNWYFYNQQAVNNGKEAFQRAWGDRQLEDNWRRSDKEMSALPSESLEEESDTTATDSVKQKRTKNDSTRNAETAASDTAKASGKERKGNDKELSEDEQKLTREYYRSKLPATEDDYKKSDQKIMAGLHAAGIIEKDELDDLPLAERTLTRLYTEYPSYGKMSDVLYQLFLLESQMGHEGTALQYKNALANQYPDDKYTLLITSPNYETDARFGKQLEDSLYQITYQAYREGNVSTMLAGTAESRSRFPEGENRAKFMFLDALGNLYEGNRAAFSSELDTLVAKYPNDDITPLAQSILKGLKAGRVPGSGLYDLSSLWDRRTSGASAMMDSLELAKQLSPERNTKFNVIIAYAVDSVDENKLLYDVAHYNFTNFSVRNFDIEQEDHEGLGETLVRGFNNFDEAHSYAQLIYNDVPMRRHLLHSKIIIISDINLEKLGVDYSINDYMNFYDKTFAPIKINPDLMLDRKIDIYQSEDELPGDAVEEQPQEEQQENQLQEDEDEYYDLE